VLDVGCGDGKLLVALLAEPAFTRIAGVDVAAGALEAAARRLRLDRLGLVQRERVALFQSSVTYRDARLGGYDAAAAVEVVEHLDPWRLDAFAAALLGAAKPATVVLTTPNAEYNVRYPGLEGGRLRHPDHRFEWSRAEFRAWAEKAAGEHGYTVRFLPVGAEDPEVGPPTQMAVLSR
jgi:3' terminal RNA ribose 2'-O-methyltransferase Hen1